MGLDVHLTDTYFIVAHFHYVMVGGLRFWLTPAVCITGSKITGKMYSEFWDNAAMIISSDLTRRFFPQFILGLWECWRRYAHTRKNGSFEHLSTAQRPSWHRSIPLLYFHLFNLRRSPANPVASARSRMAHVESADRKKNWRKPDWWCFHDFTEESGLIGERAIDCAPAGITETRGFQSGDTVLEICALKIAVIIKLKENGDTRDRHARRIIIIPDFSHLKIWDSSRN